MRYYLAGLVTLLIVGSCALRADDTPPGALPAAADQIHSVMFEVTINKVTGVWDHAQVVGGYKSNDACTAAVPRAAAAASLTAVDDDPNDVAIFLCPKVDIEGIKKEQEHAEKAPDAPPLDLRTDTPTHST